MKKKLLLVGLLFFLVITTFAKQIDENTANQVGLNFLISKTNQQNLKSAINLQMAYKVSSKNSNSSNSKQTTLFYVLNAGSSGFVIVAGDDNVSPILGYSNEGSFDPDKIPQNMAKWLEGYKSEIRSIIFQNIQATDEITTEWMNLKSASSFLANSTTVSPLIQTKWDQSPYYNALCPGGSVTGCVATAMAQIMKYWEYPSKGSGYHSYNHDTYGTLSANFGATTYQWSSMQNIVSRSNNAVATLMYQVGVSVDMDYSPEESGAYEIAYEGNQNCSDYALVTYFGYKESLQGVYKDDYTESQWMNLLKTELNAGRPILYGGEGNEGGHCFVADGYDSYNYIHFNWGWSGACDGYFRINNLNPDGNNYSNYQDAVIGIEPSTGNQSYELVLYDYVTPSSSTINYGDAFEVNTNVLNNGRNFSGDFTAAIFDEEDNFIDYIETLEDYSLQNGQVYSSNLVFSTSGISSMLPGKYYIGIYYCPIGGDWISVSDSEDYTNFIEITVINTYYIEMGSEIVVSPGTTLTQGESASVNLNIWNSGTTTFIGEYSVGLYNLDGTWAQTINSIPEDEGLPPDYEYSDPFLTFNTQNVSVTPGTYLLAVQFKSIGGEWQMVGSTEYQNPIRVTVTSPSLLADIYEANNTIDNAYKLPVSFSGSNATVNTIGSNCHIASDNDFYKVELQSGYQYTITPRIYDSSDKNNSYTLDGLFSYSTDGTIWSDTYDIIMVGNIIMNGKGTVYFHVAPYFAGQTGTYMLEMTITRTISDRIITNRMINEIKVFPNPAKDFVQIDLSGFRGNLIQLTLLNVHGQCAFTTTKLEQLKTLRIPLIGISEGIYFVQLLTDKEIQTKKLIVAK
jgi:hypothetical protein